MAERLLSQTRRNDAVSQISWTGFRRRNRVLLFLVSSPLLVFLLLPLLALIAWVSLPTLMTNLVAPEVTQAINLSMVTTLITTALALLAGSPLAYVLARYEFRGRAALDTFIDLPMLLPPSVAGIALLVAFGRRGLLGSYLSDLGIEIAFTTAAVVLAQTFVAAPFYVKTAITAFAAVDQELERAAALDGATAWQAFRSVTLPLAWPTLFAGAVMTWARALGEFGATILFAGNYPGRTQTMPLAIYLGFELNLNIALTLAAILLVVSFGVLMGVKFLLRHQVNLLHEA